MADIYERIAANFAAGGEDSSAMGWTPGEARPVDVLASALVEKLRDDPILAAIFSSADGSEILIERWDFFPFEDYDQLPKLYVYPTALEPTDSPTRLAIEDVRLYIAIRFDWFSQSYRLANYAPGVNSLLGYLRTYLYDQCGQLCIDDGGTEVIVGDQMTLQSQRVIPEQDARDTSHWMGTIELAADWKVRVDIDTGYLEDQTPP